jgi:hypothetical protein
MPKKRSRAASRHRLDPGPEEHLEHLPRWLAGSCGGLAAALAKFVGQHADIVGREIATGSYVTAANYGIGYLFGTPFLMALGAMVVFFEEKNRAKLFVMGIAAPALFTTLSSGKAVQTLADYWSISSAYAQAESIHITKNESVSVIEGIKLFLNITQPEPKYRVIVGSFKSQTEAALKAQAINVEAPRFKAFVGERMPNNEFYPVVVSDYLPLSQALKVQSNALKLKAVEGAYLSPYR